MNSRQKGARGERLWRDQLRENGWDARRGQQFSGGAESPDVVCESLGWLHQEVKCVERLNIEDAMAQARRDGRPVRARGLSEHYREIFRITRLSDFITLEDGAPDAAPAA